METITIKATERSPEINFDFENAQFLIKGESYPEDVNEFFGPLVDSMETYLDGDVDGKIHFTFELIYFNSSTAKILMGLFDMMDEAAEDGKDITITWRYEEDDENMQEMGEEYGEDLENATFVLEEIAVD